MSSRGALLLLILIGGSAVLASYVQGLASPHAASGAIWGGIPEAARGFYTTSMLFAAAGFFPFTGLFLFGIDRQQARFGRFGPGLLTALYALVLIPSALWLPLTDAYLDAPSSGLWMCIVAVLAAVALGSLGLLLCIFELRPPPRRWLRRLAVAGCLCFSFQTVVLDAVVWVFLFRT